jgi:hypothetical protein
MADNKCNEDIREDLGVAGINTGRLIKRQKVSLEHFEE